MKAAFITSLLSALTSVIAIVSYSAITVVPGGENWLAAEMAISTAFFLIWILLAFWLRPRPKLVLLPRWAQRLVVSTGVVYVIGNLLIVAG